MNTTCTIINYLEYNQSDNFLFYIIHCILANNDETSPTEFKNEEDLEFGVCHVILFGCWIKKEIAT